MATWQRLLLFLISLKFSIFNFTWFWIFRVYVSSFFCFFERVQCNKAMQDILSIWISATKTWIMHSMWINTKTKRYVKISKTLLISLVCHYERESKGWFLKELTIWDSLSLFAISLKFHYFILHGLKLLAFMLVHVFAFFGRVQ